MYPDPTSVTRITSIGAGPIGAGWAAYFLARGFDVNAYIHDPKERESFDAILDTAWISLSALGLAEGGSRDRLKVTNDLNFAIQNSDFIQESAPERIELKKALYQKLGEIVPEEVVIASSTSGLTMSEIQQICATPERCVIGHPFNPHIFCRWLKLLGGSKHPQMPKLGRESSTKLRGNLHLSCKRKSPVLLQRACKRRVAGSALHGS